MQHLWLLLFLANLPFLTAADAPETNNNPPGANYVATFPTSSDPNVIGSVTFASHPNGQGVDVHVNIAGLPIQGGPFREYLATDIIKASPLNTWAICTQSTIFMTAPCHPTATAPRPMTS